MSSDVSSFERNFRVAICNPFDETLISALINTPDEKRPKFFRGKDSTFIRSAIINAFNLISSKLGDTFSLTTSNNNRMGKDIEDTFSGISFELKLGKMTDANLGLSVVEWALDAPGQIVKIMNSMKERREMFLDGIDEETILAHKDNSKKDMENLLKRKIKVGSSPPPKLSHLAVAISKGLTTEKEIKASFGTKHQDESILIIMKKDGTFVEWDKSFPASEIFSTISLGVGPQGGGTQIHLLGRGSGRSIEFRQHFKNSYTDSATGRKIPAKYWVKTPCFHTWIEGPK